MEPLTTTTDVIDWLINDLRQIVETRCQIHGGAPGRGTGFSSCLIALVACETIGFLVAAPGASPQEAKRSFITRVGKIAGDTRYDPLAGPLFALFRHGLAHSFMPKRYELPDGSTRVTAGVNWRSDGKKGTYCIDWLSVPAGAEAFADMRRTDHLLVVRAPPDQMFLVSLQVLAIDVLRTLDDIRQKIGEGDAETCSAVERNFKDWSEAIDSLSDHRWINEAEKAYILSRWQASWPANGSATDE